MSLSEIVRMLLALALVVWLLLRQSGFRRFLKDLREKQEKEEKVQKRAEQKMEARKKARQEIEERDRKTSQVLKLAVGQLEQKSTVAAGLKIWYLEGGVANPGATVLLLHGFAAQKEDWCDFAEHLLEAGHHVVAPDLPGFGQNAKPDSTYEITAQTKRIAAFVKALDLERFHLVGSSLGGTIAATLTYKAPDLVLSLALIEPFGVRVPYESELDIFLARGVNPLTIATAAAFDNLRGFVYESPPDLPEALKQHQAEEAAKNRDFYLKMWPQILGGDRAQLLEVLLPAIRKKTMLIQGEKSKVVHPATAKIAANMLHGSQAVVIEGCGHFPAAERPEETASLFLAFLNDASAGDAAGATPPST